MDGASSDLPLGGCEFDPIPRPPHYRLIGTGMGDRLRAGIPSRYATSHLGQRSLLYVCGTGNEYRPKCGIALWLESKGRMAHSIRG